MAKLIQLVPTVRSIYAVYRKGEEQNILCVDYIGVYEGVGAVGMVLNGGEYVPAMRVCPKDYIGLFHERDLDRMNEMINGYIEIYLDVDQRHSEMRENILGILAQYKGNSFVYIISIETEDAKAFPSKYNVNINEQLIEQLEGLVGEGRVHVKKYGLGDLIDAMDQ